MLRNLKVPACTSSSTILADLDFETYSEAGYQFDGNRWHKIISKSKTGLEICGAAKYTEHPSAEVLSLAYDLKDGWGARLWIPALAPPFDLFEFINSGGTIEAVNSIFEFFVWNNICVKKYNWPPLPLNQMMDAAAKCQAFGVPGKLELAAKALETGYQKDKDGTRLLNKFSIPRNPTKNNPSLRNHLKDDPVDAQKLYNYNFMDIAVEAQISIRCPDLLDFEKQVWLTDQNVNVRGVAVDIQGVNNCIAIVKQAERKYTHELITLTGGQVDSVDKVEKMQEWLRSNGLEMPNMQKETVAQVLEESKIIPRPPRLAHYNQVPAKALRALELREILGSAAVKKLYSISARICNDGRVKGLYSYCGADRTGRWAGRGPQPQNLPNSGPYVYYCDPCDIYTEKSACPDCQEPLKVKKEWDFKAAVHALKLIESQQLNEVERYYDDAYTLVSSCLRALHISGPGKDLICSDYKAIEAVVLAAISGEQWRIDVFKTHGMIYETSASKISGVPLQSILDHKKQTGEHHPLRKIGKVAELASGYRGWVNAWVAFGALKFMSEPEIEKNVKAWRKASPNIVQFWYDCEKAFINAIKMPGAEFDCRGFKFLMIEGVMTIKLLSGRYLYYHKPVLTPIIDLYGRNKIQITYTSKVKGNLATTYTHGGKITENITQAVARDVFAFALVNLENAGYPVVLHTHDEPVSEVLEGFGSVTGFEKIMSTLPPWCADWPIKAVNGWRGKRYRKD